MAFLDEADVLHEQLVVTLHFIDGLPADHTGYVVPAVRCVLVVHRQGLLEHLVLLGGPRRGGRGDRARCHGDMAG